MGDALKSCVALSVLVGAMMMGLSEWRRMTSHDAVSNELSSEYCIVFFKSMAVHLFGMCQSYGSSSIALPPGGRNLMTMSSTISQTLCRHVGPSVEQALLLSMLSCFDTFNASLATPSGVTNRFSINQCKEELCAIKNRLVPAQEHHCQQTERMLSLQHFFFHVIDGLRSSQRHKAQGQKRLSAPLIGPFFAVPALRSSIGESCKRAYKPLSDSPEDKSASHETYEALKEYAKYLKKVLCGYEDEQQQRFCVQDGRDDFYY